MNNKYKNRKAIMGNLHPRIERFYERWGFNYQPTNIPQGKPNTGINSRMEYLPSHGDVELASASGEMDNLEDFLGVGTMMPGDLVIGGQDGRTGFTFQR